MKLLFLLARKSLLSRKWTSVLTVVSIALSSSLLLSVEKTRRASEDGFTQSVSQVDLLVGARTGPMSLILFTVFNMGNPTANVSWKTYQKIRQHPAVDWTIPFSMGDGHRGFRVVGTDQNFYGHYQFRGQKRIELSEGTTGSSQFDVVLGSSVARELKYKLGQKVVIDHGVTKGESFHHHDENPFQVAGILKPTGTSVDRSLFVTLEALESIHLEEKERESGHSAHKDHEHDHDHDHEKIEIEAITSFFLRTKNRIETLGLQREINTMKDEPLTAIIPTQTLSEIWRSLGYVEQVLRLVSWLVVSVGLVAMLIALLTSLNERRREMSILRAVGASPQLIFTLLIIESFFLTVVGVIAGLFVHFALFGFLENWIGQEFGFYFSGPLLTWSEIGPLLLMIVLGSVIGAIPAIRAMRSVLKDGLT